DVVLVPVVDLDVAAEFVLVADGRQQPRLLALFRPHHLTAPSKPNSTLSVRSCRRMRALPAPRARRTAISFSRAAARKSNKLATLTQATRSTKPTAQRKM